MNDSVDSVDYVNYAEAAAVVCRPSARPPRVLKQTSGFPALAEYSAATILGPATFCLNWLDFTCSRNTAEKITIH